MAVNKIDIQEFEDLVNEFFRFGLGEPIPISSTQGRGIGDLLDLIIEKIPHISREEKTSSFNVAIVGRPNVGKSSLFNSLVGQERAIVNEEPGTTRDAIDTFLVRDGIIYRFVDTAGLRKKGRLSGDIEYYGLIRTLRTLERAELALIVIDSSEMVTEGDQKVASLAEQRGCASIIILNKWDLVAKEERRTITEQLGRKMVFLDYAPVIPTSAITSEGISKLFPVMNKIGANYFQQVKTNQINKLISEIKDSGHLPSKKGKSLKIYYASQIGVKPPRFLFFVNDSRLVEDSFRRYLTKKIRSQLKFEGCPIFLSFRKKRKK